MAGREHRIPVLFCLSWPDPRTRFSVNSESLLTRTRANRPVPGSKEPDVTREVRSNPENAERLLAAAVGLFAKKWYGTVSVAEICLAAGLSNGVFYR
ncbi:MAG TPA: helix-turn-helix domain-containing protein, partial [Thermoanaerobaculia bacterium]